MIDAEMLIAEFIAAKGVTHCPPRAVAPTSATFEWGGVAEIHNAKNSFANRPKRKRWKESLNGHLGNVARNESINK